jgi:N-acyl homoserine lactone hydrolase
MKVERLNAGFFTSPAGIWRKGDELERKVRFPVPVYVIEAGEERILVDTGLHPGAAEDTAAHYGAGDALGMFELEQEASIADQLDLSEITRVVLTHLHFDHAGALDLLPDSVPVVIQRREWEAGADPDAIARNFLQQRDYEGIADRVELVDGDHDLLGDGSVELLLTAGHTPGHQSVRVGETLVIAGDALHYESTLEDRLFPVFADDPDAQAASADRLAALRDGGAVVLPGHDPETLAPGSVPLPPQAGP